MASNYLTRPSASSESSTKPAVRPTSTPVTESTRLFVGNLSSTVDEYTLIQVFSKCGKVAKMDFLFHKTGPLKGKPRGYAFVEFSTKEEAAKAVAKLHDRMLRGRKLAVSPASAMNPEYMNSGSGKPYRRGDPPKTTTLSLLKSHKRPQSAEAQIAALEAKLNAMEHSPLAVAGRSATPESDVPADDRSKGKRRADDEGSKDDDIEKKAAKRTRHDASSTDKMRTGANRGLPPLSAGLPAKPSQATLDTATYQESLKRG